MNETAKSETYVVDVDVTRPNTEDVILHFATNQAPTVDAAVQAAAKWLKRYATAMVGPVWITIEIRR